MEWPRGANIFSIGATLTIWGSSCYLSFSPFVWRARIQPGQDGGPTNIVFGPFALLLHRT